MEYSSADNADLAAAKDWSQSWKDVDIGALGKSISDSYDPALLKAQLDELVAGAHTETAKASAAAEATKREGFKLAGPENDINKAAAATSKSFGGFNVAALN